MSSPLLKQQSNTNTVSLEIFVQAQKDWNKQVIEEILDLLNEQYSTYQNLRYLDHGKFSIVLQATKNKTEKVALKITEYKSKPQIQKEKELMLLKQVFESQYIAKVKEFFYLREQDEQQSDQLIKQDNENETDQCYRYEVIEMELCQQNLRKQLQYFRDSQEKLSENQKEIIAIQMLDSVNLIHSKSILHRNIKPENFLTSISHSEDWPFALKLSDLELTSNLNEKISKSKQIAFDKQRTVDYLSQEALDGKYKKQSDLFSLGIVFIELDNYDLLDFSKISIIESIRKEGISALKSFKIHEKGLLFEIAKVFLDPQYQKRKSSVEMLEMLISQKGHQNVPLYSVITKANVHSLMINNSINYPINKMNAKNLPPQLSLEEIKSAITQLQNNQTFSLFTFLGQGQSGVVFSAVNLKYKRECTLKVTSAKNKAIIMRQISVLSRCHSPYIVKFYGYQFFQDQSNNEFVVFEFEKCLCTLTQFLEQDKLEQQITQEQKTRLAVQIIDSVALLHRQNVLHGDIKLDNFLLSEDGEGRDIIKLIGFTYAGILNPDKSYDLFGFDKVFSIENENCLYLGGGSLAYLSPERYHSQDKPSTKLSDSFSVGICLLLLDNFNSFKSELASKQYQLLFPYKQPYQDCLKLFNLESKIYEWALQFLAFDPNKRLIPEGIVDKMVDPPSPLYSIWNNKFPLNKEHIEAPCLFFESLQNREIEKLIIQYPTFLNLKSLEISKIQRIEHISLFISHLPSLSSLYLDFQENKVTSLEVGNLFKIISKLSSLSSFQIDLNANSISNEGKENIFQHLSSLTSLTSLNLFLSENKFTSLGVGNLFKAISTLSSLSSLQIDFRNNSISNEGEENIYQDLSALSSLQQLYFNFENNRLTNQGVTNLFKSISKLFSLSSLLINFNNIQISNEGKENIFQHLSELNSLSSLNFYLENTKLTSFGVGNLLQAISQLSSLSFLQISLENNSITIEREEFLYQDLSALSQLSSLKLFIQKNNLSSQGVINLFKSISKLPSLSSLQIDLSNNQIENEGEENIYSHLQQQTLLTSLKLNFRYNKLTSFDLGNLFKSISKFSSLSTLQIILGYNSITKEGEENIYYDLSSLTSLSQLTISFEKNKLTSFGAGNLLKSISKISSLSSLEINVGSNSISIEGEVNIAEDLSALTQLSKLNLNFEYNKLTSFGVGNLFKSISTLASLTSLQMNLWNNSISNAGEETIDQDLSLLTSLSSLILNFQNNKLTSFGLANVFKSISKLSSLSSLEISLINNSITKEREGNIFQDLSYLTSLASLNLHFKDNKLTSFGLGSLFKAISKLSSLSSLQIYIWNNSISNEGEENIYQNLQALTSLSLLKLELENNKLTNLGLGNLLKSISKLSSLSFLEIHLGNNSITNEGEENIFQHLSELTQLSQLILDFYQSKLTCIGIGNLLKCISKLPSLSSLQIDFRDNKIKNQEKLNKIFNSMMIKIEQRKLRM